jgi:glutathione S-transferase
LKLYIGNKNYSSWSLRPWLLLRHLQVPFEEVQILLDTHDFKSKLTHLGAAGRVPVLVDGTLVIWDSLAICEYAMELTGRGLPRDAGARARARSVSAEMHSGFQALRSAWPMNARARGRRTSQSEALLADVARIDTLWRTLPAEAGAWLFGDYGLADAMFAPVALRFLTYGAQLSAGAQAYLHSVLADPILQDWIEAAAREPWVLPQEEIGRQE